MAYFFISLFWATVLLIGITYAIYPLVIWLAGIFVPFKVKKQNNLPFISVIIPAFNEARHIASKVENTISVDYPEDRMEILIGSDGSTDETAVIMDKYTDDRVCFIHFQQNRGKTAVQNDLVNKAQGDILVFTDAASFVSPDAFKALVSNFRSSRVGCVAGCMRFLSTDKNLTTKSQGLYWRYESKIRELESRLGSLIGVDGPLYAVKAENYVSLESHMISDLLTPLLILDQGKKVVLEPRALVYEEPTTKTGQEFKTRRRITLRGLVGLWTHKYLLNPVSHPFLAMQIFFHKILRWGVGVLWGINIMSCIALAKNPLFLGVLGLHGLFILMAALGWMATNKRIQSKFLTIPYYFCLVNLAATMGILDFLMRKKAVAWKPVRE